MRLDRSLREELNSTLKLEEKFWALKSRVGWVVDRDKNANIFHTSTIIRRRFNKILRLKNSVGDWMENSDTIRDHSQSGFIDLFSTSHTASIPCLAPVPFAPRILEEESLTLETPCSPCEVKLSLWSMKPFKAPMGTIRGSSKDVSIKLGILLPKKLLMCSKMGRCRST